MRRSTKISASANAKARSRWISSTAILLLPFIAAAPLPSEPSDSPTPIPSSTFSESITSTSAANNAPLSTLGTIRTMSAAFITASATPSAGDGIGVAAPAAAVSAMDADTDWDIPMSMPTAMSGWDDPSAPSLDGDTTMVPVLIEPNSETSTITVGPASTASASPTPIASWSLPSDFSDMSPFTVKTYAAGKSNLAILSGSPAPFNGTSSASESDGAPSSTTDPWDPTTNALQILYPSGSINPGNKPQGGSEFYANPLDLTKATNASMQYSVYFPHDFDFVKGGKLPGLYGGHKGCSGGNSAEDCFSTRLMWRAGGLGELYLYAPKDKQTPELCQTKPRSICDAAYGLSIGRGAWTFALGDWTTVRQDVWLNTPGQNDGGFNIWVNGQLVLSASDVRYRENPDACLQGESNEGDGSVDAAQVPTINAIGISGHPHNGSSGIVDEDWQIAEEMLGSGTITHYSTQMATITMTATMPLATEYTTFTPSSPPPQTSSFTTSPTAASAPADPTLSSTSSASSEASPSPSASATAALRRRQDETADASEIAGNEDASQVDAASASASGSETETDTDSYSDSDSTTDAAQAVETVTASASPATLVSPTTAFITIPVTATATTTATIGGTDQPLVLAAPTTQYSTVTVTQSAMSTPMGDSLAWPTLEAAAMPASPSPTGSPSSMDDGPLILHPDPAFIHITDVQSDSSSSSSSVDAQSAQPSNTLQPIVVRPPPTVQIASSDPGLPDASAQSAGPGCGVGFTGLFFSTFFGGHTSDWASPKDQYSYFKDFKVWVNN
ncbi:hypothetical protein IAT40_006149 [Kwoniella sp. CBS 6097]